MDDYVRTCMCGAPGRESAARDRPIDMCSRLSALVCPRAEDGSVCVCVSPFFKTCGHSGRHRRPKSQDPCSSALPDRYRSEWAAPDGSMVARTLGVMAAAEERLQQPSPKRTRSEQPVSHGCLSGRQWVDVQRAARIASATNVQLTVHGIVVDGFAARDSSSRYSSCSRSFRAPTQCPQHVEWLTSPVRRAR